MIVHCTSSEGDATIEVVETDGGVRLIFDLAHGPVVRDLTRQETRALLEAVRDAALLPPHTGDDASGAGGEREST